MGNMNPVHVLQFHVRNNHFNIILPSTPGPLKTCTYSSSDTYPIPCRTSVPPCEQHTVQLGLNMSVVCYCTWIKTVRPNGRLSLPVYCSGSQSVLRESQDIGDQLPWMAVVQFIAVLI